VPKINNGKLANETDETEVKVMQDEDGYETV
jgi:hypothetical protein